MPRRSNDLRGREREKKKRTASVERLKKRMDNRDSCLNLFTLQTLPLQEENTHSSRKEEGKEWRERERERDAWPRASSKTTRGRADHSSSPRYKTEFEIFPMNYASVLLSLPSANGESAPFSARVVYSGGS